ncbi:LLM class flavin-dependent oxidoreductase [Klebsiella pneumoniae]|nr:LLM class flavin-dependent oxidoreductase [Klebsiella pneumoniae]
MDQRAAGGYSQRFPIRPSRPGPPFARCKSRNLPIYFGGLSEAAIAVAGKHADVFALWGESLAQTGEIIQHVRAEAAKHQRDIGFSVSFRCRLSPDSEAEAWEKAEHISARRHRAGGAARRRVQSQTGLASAPSGCGLLRRRAEWWTNVCGPASPSWWAADITPHQALVGTPEQVADALLDYYDLGVRNFLIRGFSIR